MVKDYGPEEIKAFCSHCKKITLHRYQSFSQAGAEEAPTSGIKALFTGLLEAITTVAMEGEPNRDYQCQVCGTNLTTPDHLDCAPIGQVHHSDDTSGHGV
ncbi:hypothetical protein SAMN02745129_1561 [Ferrimonas marina]|uniref:Uncharacterized protein n=1 Tax=Ferrimonas marina TaxID=299255 RepID=A0A1M5RBQ5_9GAMM|nr:hypothetical protein SAMN02745129_1561 [Ferrimonas marina]